MATVKLTELMKERQLLSFELFPPKTDKGMENLPGTIEHLCEFKPEYISVTYGAGGGNVGTNREEGIKDQLETYLSEGVDHILALRGDFPRGENSTGGDFNYATDLVKFIRKEFGDKFEIAVAGSPEGHIACRSLDADISVLKMKQDNGADYIMTQLCWDMEQFARWQDKIRKAGVTMPIEKAGIEYTIKQIDKYRALGVEGIHLYALNKWKDVSEIIKESGMRTLV